MLTLAAMLCLIMITAPRSHAAGYREITYSDTTPVKVGNYFFKYDNDFYYSTEKDFGYTSLGYNKIATNGTKVVYAEDNKLMSRDLNTGAVKKLKKLPKGKRNYEQDYWNVSVAKGDQIFLTRSSEEKWTYWTYVYNVKKKSLKKVMNKCSLVVRCGKYVVGANAFQTDVSAHQKTLYKIGSGKLKKVRVLSKYCFTATYIGKKLYYTSSNNSSMRKTTLYRATVSGGKKKKLGAFTAKGEYGQAVISGDTITKTNCVVYFNGGSYLYTYKTKKLVKQ